ncbi:hypothetical protein [Fodinibius salsisoli]|uniref:DUF4834 domain-containing protein n=1 Tax=Fodinibius salsisoli TaxID=2820877 RepID=A0ABT3PNP4_9BACT|nr:hypothetical protein [Fodinibius salsisoli]MCW9707469.1 hypothetical protein [Fodinibius salsisoli]
MIRTLLVIVLVYFLIKIIGRLFLSSGSKNSRKSKARVFYDTFRQFQQNQQQHQNQRSNQKRGGDRFEEVEEAEFEDVTEKDNSTAKSSD